MSSALFLRRVDLLTNSFLSLSSTQIQHQDSSSTSSRKMPSQTRYLPSIRQDDRSQLPRSRRARSGQSSVPLRPSFPADVPTSSSLRQDPCFWVRLEFVKKLGQALHSNKLPASYNVMLFLTAHDEPDVRDIVSFQLVSSTFPSLTDRFFVCASFQAKNTIQRCMQTAATISQGPFPLLLRLSFVRLTIRVSFPLSSCSRAQSSELRLHLRAINPSACSSSGLHQRTRGSQEHREVSRRVSFRTSLNPTRY